VYILVLCSRLCVGQPGERGRAAEQRDSGRCERRWTRFGQQRAGEDEWRQNTPTLIPPPEGCARKGNRKMTARIDRFLIWKFASCIRLAQYLSTIKTSSNECS
jgi:hypothetical protein